MVQFKKPLLLHHFTKEKEGELRKEVFQRDIPINFTSFFNHKKWIAITHGLPYQFFVRSFINSV